MSTPADSTPALGFTGLQILVVEDESLVALDLEERLVALGHQVLAVVDNGADAIAYAKVARFDLVLMDIHIRGPIDGVETAAHLRGLVDSPVIFVTAHADPATLLRAGLTEPFGYVLKPFDERELNTAVQMAIYRHRAESKLRKMEQWLSTTLRSIGDGVIATDSAARITFINAMAEAVTGWTRGSAVGRYLSEVFAVGVRDGNNEADILFQRAMTEGATITLREDRMLRTRNGDFVPVDDSIAPIRDEHGVATGCVIIFRDRTSDVEAEKERKQLETRMQEAQRLESLGVLAAGIAHDFNNLLVAVTCNASLVRAMTADDSPAVPCLQDIESAADRAALLCSQILAYAGKGQRAMEILDLSSFTRDIAQLLQVGLHKDTRLILEVASDLPCISADRSQLQQIIMNLVINGSEALEGAVGTVTVRTGLCTATRRLLSACRIGADLAEGEYLLLEVSDTGQGMTSEVLSRIFDPFFTTKFTGRGLGLSAISGIVRSHGGALAVESARGVGTTFRVLFPAAHSAGPTTPPPSFQTSWRGHGRALLVDDDISIRLAGGAVLRHLGFEVDVVEDGNQAVERATAPGANYTVVVLDITMPNLDGPGALQAIRAVDPSLPVLLMSGYSHSQVESLFHLGGPLAFIQKPFNLQTLVAKLRPLLAQGS